MHLYAQKSKRTSLRFFSVSLFASVGSERERGVEHRLKGLEVNGFIDSSPVEDGESVRVEGHGVLLRELHTARNVCCRRQHEFERQIADKVDGQQDSDQANEHPYRDEDTN